MARIRRRHRIPQRDGTTLGSLELRHLDSYESRELTTLLLTLVGLGVIVFAALAAPNLVQVLKWFPGMGKDQEQKLSRKMRYLVGKGYLEMKNGRYQVSKKGQRLLNEERVWNLAPRTTAAWDGNWHAVLFDIPGEKRYERSRQALRARLEELGYVRYQNSILVHHRDDRAILEPFIAYYGLYDFVRFMTIRACDGEQELRAYFKLKSKPRS
jgi:DNA-binding transcriptional regulator PaaX